MNIASNGTKLFESNVSGSLVIVTYDSTTVQTNAALGPLMGANISGGEAIAVQPGTNNIGIVARIGSGTYADKGYFCTINEGVASSWLLLGPTAQPQCIAWINTQFVSARVGPGGSSLIEQSPTGAVIKTTAVATSEGILYYDEVSKKFVIANTSLVTTVGSYKLIKAVRRLLNGQAIYTGQKTNPDILLTTNGTTITFQSGPQPNYPQFIVIGESLVVNGGTTYDPPYPGGGSIPPSVTPCTSATARRK